MISFDGDLVAKAVAARATEQKWNPDRALLVSRICGWHVAYPDADVGYEGGRPNAGMRDMIDGVTRDTGLSRGEVLGAFGASHCLLCDTVPGFRPVLYSAWDRSEECQRHD